MDTLSSSVSTIRLVPATALPHHPSSSSSASREPIHHHFKSRRSSLSSQYHPTAPFGSSTTTSLSLCKARESRNSSPNLRRSASSVLHVHHYRKAASGYAAALIDAAQSDGSLQLLQRDVGRLSRLLGGTQLQEVMEEPSLSTRDKGVLLREIMSGSGASRKFHRHLMALMNMFIGKDKLHLIRDTLDEFGRIYAALICKKPTLPSPSHP